MPRVTHLLQTLLVLHLGLAALLAGGTAVVFAQSGEAEPQGETGQATEPGPFEDEPFSPFGAAFGTQSGPDYEAWLVLVERAEDTIDVAEASDAALESLRRELIEWRNIFQQAQSINASRIRSVEAQIAALGPPPAEGESEPASVAELRHDLNAGLDELMVPVRQAEVAFNNADALIIEIDQMLRQRQAQRLVDRVASPLLPATWAHAWNEVVRVELTLANEIRSTLDSPAQRAMIRERLPAAIFLLVLGVVLIVVGRRLTERLSDYVARRGNGAATHLGTLIISLGQIVFPVVGLMVLLIAGRLTFASGFLTQTLLGAFVQGGIIIVIARWLAMRVFPVGEGVTSIGNLAERDRNGGRRNGLLLGILLAAHTVVESFGTVTGLSGETQSVLNAPIVVLSSIVLWRLGSLFLRIARDTEVTLPDPAETPSRSEAGFLSGIFWILGQALYFSAIVGPLAAAVGYANFAEFLIFPVISSLGILAVISILHRFFADLYALVTRSTAEAARDALVPVLLTLAVGVASIPVFALAWGARWTEIVEAWQRISDGFAIGDTRIGLGALFTMILVFALGYGLTRLLQATLRSAVLPRTKLDIGGRNALTVGVGYVGMTIAAIVAITAAGIDLTAFALVASALSVGIGFGLRTVVENFVAGLIMLIERPISEGDWIEVGEHMGIVKDISVRATRIEAFDRSDLIIPNSQLVAGLVTNYTRGKTVGRLIVPVGVRYTSDSRHVEKVLLEVCEAHPLVAMDPPPRVMFRGFGADALLMECFCILRDVNFRLQVHSDINHAIHERFREEGIEIPFPQRDLWLRNPEVLPGAPPAPPEASLIDDLPPDDPPTQVDTGPKAEGDRPA